MKALAPSLGSLWTCVDMKWHWSSLSLLAPEGAWHYWELTFPISVINGGCRFSGREWLLFFAVLKAEIRECDLNMFPWLFWLMDVIEEGFSWKIGPDEVVDWQVWLWRREARAGIQVGTVVVRDLEPSSQAVNFGTFLLCNSGSWPISPEVGAVNPHNSLGLEICF